MVLSSENPTYIWKIDADRHSNAATFYYTFGEVALACVDFDPDIGACTYHLPIDDYSEPFCNYLYLEDAMTAVETAIHVSR